MRVRVNEGTQVHHNGKLYTGGDEFDAPSEEANKWLAAGWATEAKSKKRTAPNKGR
jgi:hypothetical protein